MNTPEQDAAEVAQASNLGRAAYAAGILRYPIMDDGLNVLLAGVGSSHHINVLKAWLAAWDAANLAVDDNSSSE